MKSFDAKRLFSLIKKETLQMIRDPSTFIVAFVLPAILLFLYAYAVSLDIKNLPIGLVRETDSVKAQSLSAAYSGTKYFVVHPMRNRKEARAAIIRGSIKGFVVIPADFEKRITNPDKGSMVEIVSDGAQPNTAQFVANASLAVAQNWLSAQIGEKKAPIPQVVAITRFWFNAEMESRKTLIPGGMAIVMTMIGSLLTAMVVAREWERGTMEAMMATPASIIEILVGKILPYFLLGLVATLICGILAVYFFGVELHGSWLALILVSAAFLIPSLMQGLFASSVTKDQFSASQIALLLGFLPAIMFSGFIYEISAMPLPLRIVSALVPARYYVESLRTVFLVGDIWPILLPNIFFMLLVGVFFFIRARASISTTLDGKKQKVAVK